MISIHAPREGGDPRPCRRGRPMRDFNPRPPRGGRRAFLYAPARHQIFQSTPPREGGDRPYKRRPKTPLCYFNPRPPRGGRRWPLRRWTSICYFNPRPPRGGRRDIQDTLYPAKTFQSTPPARGATAASPGVGRSRRHFNPRPPRGGRHGDIQADARRSAISIHAPREGGDRT